LFICWFAVTTRTNKQANKIKTLDIHKGVEREVIIVHTNKEREETENKENVLAVTKTVTEETSKEELLALRRLLLLFAIICIGLFLITLLVILLK
jgi:hypothetical protein